MNQLTQSSRVRIGRGAYLLFSVIFAALLIIQVLLAGMAVFVGAENWLRHSTLVHLFGFNLPLFMLLTAFIGKMPRWAYWNVLGLLVLIVGMYFTANFITVAPWVGAIHPVLAMVLFVFSVGMVSNTWKFVRKRGLES
ncbi:DUF6220 domain-containing protein [Ferdinandcohnia sp. Marseille-Q9671]